MPSGLVMSVGNNMIHTMASTNMNVVLTQRKSFCVLHVAMDLIINHSWTCILQLMTQLQKYTVKTVAKALQHDILWQAMHRFT